MTATLYCVRPNLWDDIIVSSDSRITRLVRHSTGSSTRPEWLFFDHNLDSHPLCKDAARRFLALDLKPGECCRIRIEVEPTRQAVVVPWEGKHESQL